MEDLEKLNRPKKENYFDKEDYYEQESIYIDIDVQKELEEKNVLFDKLCERYSIDQATVYLILK
jgi:hypothetical protein